MSCGGHGWTICAGATIALALLWSVVHHLLAGLRHLLLDMHVGVELAPARRSSVVVLVLGIVVTAAIALRLW